MTWDLRARIAIDGADEALSEIQQLSEEFDDLAAVAEEAGASIDELSAEAVGSLGEAEEAAGGFRGALAELGADFQQARAGLGTIGMAMLGFTMHASDAAIALEDYTTRLRLIAGEVWPELAATMEEEVERTRRRLTFGQLAEALIPVAATLQEATDIIMPYMDEINNALLMGGMTGEKFAMAWTYVAQAIATGNAQLLTRPSRMLPFPIIQGQEAIEIARQMKKEYDLLTNARIFAEAVAHSEAITQEQLNTVFETTASRLQMFRGTWGDFLEEFGAAAAKARGWIAEVFADPLELLIRSGDVRRIGEVMGIFSLLASAVGGTAVLAKLAGLIGIGGGTIGSFLMVALPWAALLFAAATVIRDIFAVFTGGRSIIWEGMKYLWEGIKGIPRLFGQAWDELLIYLGQFHGWLDRHITRPALAAFEKIESAIMDFGDRVAAFFGVETERMHEERGREFAEQAAAAAVVGHLAPEAEPVVKQGGEIDWVETARQALGEHWMQYLAGNQELQEQALQTIEQATPEEYREAARQAFEEMMAEIQPPVTEEPAPVPEERDLP